MNKWKNRRFVSRTNEVATATYFSPERHEIIAVCCTRTQLDWPQGWSQNDSQLQIHDKRHSCLVFFDD